MTPLIAGGPLPSALKVLVAYIAAPLGPTAALIEAQAVAAIVLAGSPTIVDVEVPPTIGTVPLPDGPIPVTALVYDDKGDVEGEILVWLRSGMLIGIEQAWFTDDAPTGWPSPSKVQLS